MGVLPNKAHRSLWPEKHQAAVSPLGLVVTLLDSRPRTRC